MTIAKKVFDQKDIEQNKTLAALSYLWILSILIYLLKKDSPYVQFHAKQGTVLFAASVVIGFIPPAWALNVIIALVALVGLARAYQGQAWEIPLVNDLAQKISF